MSYEDYMELLVEEVGESVEIEAMEERWEVAKLLFKGKLTYREIASKLSTSTATVTRVARFLFKESNQGYINVLKQV